MRKQFVERFSKFIDSTVSMVKERNKIEERTPQFETTDWKYKKMVVEPMDTAWDKLSEKDKTVFGDLLIEAMFGLKKKETDKQTVDLACKMFGGKVLREVPIGEDEDGKVERDLVSNKEADKDHSQG